MAERDDEALIAAFRGGDKQAAGELLTRHLVRVRSMVFQMVLNDATADELTQEVFLRALKGLPGFNGRSQFSTWLFRVTMNTTHSFLSRKQRSPVQFQSELPDPAEKNEARPEQHAMHGELASQIEAALAGLSPVLRAAIVLTGIQGHNAKEAAEIEGCTTATMYWRIHEARKQLKRELHEYLS